MNDKEKIFWWLFYPFEINSTNETIETVISLSKKYIVPENLLFRKIIEYLIIKENNKNQIANKLLEFKLIDSLNIDFLEKMIDEINHSKFNKPTQENISKIKALAQIYTKINEQGNHNQYPLPHSSRGRPRLTWEECYHENCHKIFNNPIELVRHLEKFGKYKRGFHLYYEIGVYDNKLTPEKILNQKIKVCPSIICDKANHKFTPEELCEHLKILGIPPFWKPGMIIRNTQVTTDIYKPIFTSSK
jgi:hypothetical protein